MPEESTTPDLVELAQRVIDAVHAGWVTQRYAAVATLAAGLIERQSNYNDIDEARAAAEQLAQELG